MTLGDIVNATRRYQPVMIAVAVLLIVFALLPEPERVAGVRDEAASLLDQTRAATPRTGVSQPAGAMTDTGVVPPSPGIGDVTFSPSAAPSFVQAEPAFGAGGSADSGGSSDSSTGDLPTFGGPSIDSDEATGGEPLRIVGSTWASRQAGTPLAAEGVPSGTLPVGMRVTEDKLSFIRLAGDETLLELVEEPAGARSTNGPVIMQICQVTAESWSDGEATAMDAAPAWDAADCELGTRSDDGVWTFDLQNFASPTDGRGFALVPGDGAGVDWQVAFKKSA